ncbi:MAG: RDD family protein [Bacteroidetes bacterium]|nr:RDD family protein [Bacteroidota bacterium]
MAEQQDLLNEFLEPTYQYASIGQRFANYLIDVIAFYAILFVIIFLLRDSGLVGSEGFQLFLIFIVFIGYYTLLEGGTGKSVGKMVSKTKVVQVDGTSINFRKAFMRSLCRLVPFEFLSAFGGGSMLHDKWTDTMVVQDSN